MNYWNYIAQMEYVLNYSLNLKLNFQCLFAIIKVSMLTTLAVIRRLYYT